MPTQRRMTPACARQHLGRDVQPLQLKTGRLQELDKAAAAAAAHVERPPPIRSGKAQAPPVGLDAVLAVEGGGVPVLGNGVIDRGGLLWRGGGGAHGGKDSEFVATSSSVCGVSILGTSPG